MGILLTWLVERPPDDQTFVVLTMNRVDGISPESFRAGRFDQIFHTTLPDGPDRWAILCLHLRRAGIDPAIYDRGGHDRFVSITDGYSGAEIEQALTDARFVAFARSGKALPTIEELVGACSKIHSAKRLDPENIAAIEDFCRRAGTCPVARPRLTAPNTRATRAVDVSGFGFDDN